jgi:hypothetical protein
MWTLPLPKDCIVEPASHAGIIFSAIEELVVAPTFGEVIEVGNKRGNNYIVLDAHNRYYILLYGLIDSVNRGYKAKPGEFLGLAGASTLYCIGIKPHHPLYTQAKPGTAVHPRTFHEGV